jgi:hypothetical protein
MTEVTITSGDKEAQRAGSSYQQQAWSVPKRDLMAGVQVVGCRGKNGGRSNPAAGNRLVDLSIRERFC